MNDEPKMVALGAEVGGASRLLSIVYRNQELEARVAELEYELAEDKAELRRHHDDFLKVQGLLSDAENVIQSNPAAMPEDEMTLDEVWSIIRSIRNIVG